LTSSATTRSDFDFAADDLSTRPWVTALGLSQTREKFFMSNAVIRRTLGVLAVSACTLGMAASAQAANGNLAITSPVSASISNNLSPTVSFTGATTGDLVTLTSDGAGPGGASSNDDGSATANIGGGGTITPTNPVNAGPDVNPTTLTLTETGVDQDSTQVTVNLNIVPTIEISPVNDVFDAGDVVSLGASGAIANHPVHTVFTPHGGSALPTVVQTADGSGDIVAGITPQGPLAANDYAVSMTTLDANSVASTPATADIFIAPVQPTITSPTDGENINQTTPPVTVSGVLSGATVALYTLDTQSQPVLLAHTTASASGNLTFTNLSPGLTDNAPDPLFAVQTVNENGTNVASDGGAGLTDPAGGPQIGTPNQATPTVINVDTAAPVLSSFGLDSGDATITDNQPDFSTTNGAFNSQTSNSGVEFFLTGPNGPLNSGFVTTGGGGNSDWTPLSMLPDGSYTITANSIDDTGHVGTASNTLSFIVDTTPPTAPRIVSPADGSTVSTGTPPITVHGDAGTQMCIAIDIGAADEQDPACQTADSDGNATFALTTALGNGAHALLADSFDEVGNVSETDSSFTVIVPDATPAPTTTLPTATPPTTTTPPATTTPTTTPTPKPPPAPAAPKTLTLSSHTLSAGHPVKFSFSLTKPGMVTVTVIRTVHGKSKVVGTELVKVTKAGKHSVALSTRFAGHTLAKGSYTLSLQAGTGKHLSKAIKTKLTVG
jgi:hypothetical protein